MQHQLTRCYGRQGACRVSLVVSPIDKAHVEWFKDIICNHVVFLQNLIQKLKPGGRMVIPVGAQNSLQVSHYSSCRAMVERCNTTQSEVTSPSF